MFTLCDSTTPKDLYTSMLHLLVDLRDAHGYDTIKAIHLTNDKNHPYVRIGCSKTGGGDIAEYSYMLNIRSFEKSFFSLLCAEKKTVVFTGTGTKEKTQKYAPIDPTAKTEVYFPVLEEDSDEVIGCVYLGLASEMEPDIASFMADYRLDLLRHIIAIMYKETVNPNQIVTFLRLFDEFLMKNNPHMLRHHFNVAFLCCKIADEMGLSLQEKDNLYFACLLHDIGEIYINSSLLNKKGKLSEREYKIEKNHVVYGSNLIRQISMNEPNREGIVSAILQHHERYDGTGYPQGLKGRGISLFARMIAVADAVDSMISKRSYKTAKTRDETIKDLKMNKGKQFDPRIVDLMIKALYERTSGKLKIKEMPILIAALGTVDNVKTGLMQGMLIPKREYYEFHPAYLSDIDSVEWAANTELKLYYVANQDVYELNARLAEIKNGIIYLKEMESRFAMISYSLFWELPGVIDLDGERFHPIKTTRISGDALTFVASDDVAIAVETNKEYKICITFDKDDPETLIGTIMQRFTIGSDSLFFFSFEDAQEAVKERIFRRIVRKQADLKVSYLFDSN